MMMLFISGGVVASVIVSRHVFEIDLIWLDIR